MRKQRKKQCFECGRKSFWSVRITDEAKVESEAVENQTTAAMARCRVPSEKSKQLRRRLSFDINSDPMEIYKYCCPDEVSKLAKLPCSTPKTNISLINDDPTYARQDFIHLL